MLLVGCKLLQPSAICHARSVCLRARGHSTRTTVQPSNVKRKVNKGKRVRTDEQVNTALQNAKARGARYLDYFKALVHYAGKANVEEAEKLFREVKEVGFRRSVKTYTVLLNMFAKKGDYERVSFYFDLMQIEPLRPDRVVYQVLLTAAATCRRHDAVDEILDSMIAKRILIGGAGLARLFGFYLSIGNFKKAEEVASVLYADTDFFQRRRVKYAGKLGSLVRDPEMRTNSIKKHGSLLQLFCLQGKVAEAEEVWDELKTKFGANAIVYTMMIQMYGRIRDVDKAEGLFNEMVDNGFKSDTPIHNALLNLYTKNLNNGKIESLLDGLTDKGLQADASTITMLIDMCAKIGDTQGAEQLFEDLLASNVHPTTYTFNVMINLSAKTDNLARMELLLNQMKTLGLEPDAFTLTSFLEVYAKNLRVAEAEAIFRKIGPEPIPYNTLAKLYIKVGATEKVNAILAEMRQLGFVPDEGTQAFLNNYQTEPSGKI